MNALFGNEAKEGSFVRSLLHINANDLKFTDEKDGTKKAVIEVLAMSFGDNGQIVDQLAKSYAITAKPGEMKTLLAEGVILITLRFPSKSPDPINTGSPFATRRAAASVPQASLLRCQTFLKSVWPRRASFSKTSDPRRPMAKDCGHQQHARPPTNAMSDTALSACKDRVSPSLRI